MADPPRDYETIPLIDALLVAAGGMMEAESVGLVKRLPADCAALSRRVRRFAQTSARLAALAAAAEVFAAMSEEKS